MSRKVWLELANKLDRLDSALTEVEKKAKTVKYIPVHKMYTYWRKAYVGLIGLQPSVDKVGLYSLSAAGVTHGLVSELCDQTQQSLTLELCRGQKGKEKQLQEQISPRNTNLTICWSSFSSAVALLQRGRPVADRSAGQHGADQGSPGWSLIVFLSFQFLRFIPSPWSRLFTVFKFKFHLFLSLGAVRERSDAS